MNDAFQTEREWLDSLQRLREGIASRFLDGRIPEESRAWMTLLVNSEIQRLLNRARNAA